MPRDSYEVPETTTFAESEEIVIICASIILAGILAGKSSVTSPVGTAIDAARDLINQVLAGSNVH